MFTYEDYLEWLKLTYEDEIRYCRYELMWHPEYGVPNNNEIVDKDSRLRELNKLMIAEFPFLLPRNRWTDQPMEDYDYSYNEWQAIALGWQINFGWRLLHELNILVQAMEHPENFRIEQIKEKFGEFRLYCNGNMDIYQLIDDYTALSRTICIRCGKPATVASTSWISFYCDDCAKRLNLKDIKPIAEFEHWWNGEDETNE